MINQPPVPFNSDGTQSYCFSDRCWCGSYSTISIPCYSVSVSRVEGNEFRVQEMRSEMYHEGFASTVGRLHGVPYQE